MAPGENVSFANNKGQSETSHFRSNNEPKITAPI